MFLGLYLFLFALHLVFFIQPFTDEVGIATRLKLIHNMILGNIVASLAEAMALAEKVGIDLEDFAEVLSLGSMACHAVKHKSQGMNACVSLSV